jgi:D-alanine transaminase
MSHNLPDLPCYLNGEYTVLSQAKVSVMDRGFIFGDGIYEVVPAYAGVPFRFNEHMARMQRGLNELRIDNPLSQAEWASLVETLVEKLTSKSIATTSTNTGTNGQNDAKNAPKAAADSAQLVYIQITRGVAMRDHVMLPNMTPTVFAFVNHMKPPSAEQRTKGVACVSADDFRWAKAHIKSTSLLGAVMSRQISADVGAMETIMFRGDNLSEAAASNVWLVKNGRVIGPKKNNLVLEGIRYGFIEQLCAQQGIGFELRNITRQEVLEADELMLSSATKEVLPITLLDGKPVGSSGQPGPVTLRLFDGYQAAKAASIEAANNAATA